MMNKTKIYAISIPKIGLGVACAFFLFACGNQCDEFPQSGEKWVPYEEGDTLRYFSGSDTIEFIVQERFLSLAQTEEEAGLGYNCNQIGYYYTDTLSSHPYLIREQLELGNKRGMTVSISPEDTSFFFDIQDYATFNDSLKVDFYPDTIINDSLYYEVLKVGRDTLDFLGRIPWFIKARDKGILQFYDFEMKRTWTLLEE